MTEPHCLNFRTPATIFRLSELRVQGRGLFCNSHNRGRIALSVRVGSRNSLLACYALVHTLFIYNSLLLLTYFCFVFCILSCYLQACSRSFFQNRSFLSPKFLFSFLLNPAVNMMRTWKYGIHLSCLMTKPTKGHVRAAKTQISLGIRPVFAVRTKKAWVLLSYPMSAQWRIWSDWVDA